MEYRQGQRSFICDKNSTVPRRDGADDSPDARWQSRPAEALLGGCQALAEGLRQTWVFGSWALADNRAWFLPVPHAGNAPVESRPGLA